MPSSHLILYRPLLLLPPIPPSIRVFSNESSLRMRWPKYWSFSFSIIPSSEHPGLISFRIQMFTWVQTCLKFPEPRAFLHFTRNSPLHALSDLWKCCFCSFAHLDLLLFPLPLFKKYIYIFISPCRVLVVTTRRLFSCGVHSRLQHVGSSSLTRDQTQAPCTGSTES